MEALLQAQELRIQQLETQRNLELATREAERTQLIADFRDQLEGLRTQIAAEGPASASSRPPGLESRLVDTRVIGKPDMFYGERERWKDWSMILKAYMMAVDPAYVDSFDRLEKDVTPMHNASLSPRSTKLSVQLYYVLVMLSRAKAQDKLNVVSQGEGYIAWQRFLADYDPKIRTRRVGMLIQILTATFTGDLAQALDQFDRLIKEYEQCCEDEVTCPACQHKWRKPFDEQLKAGLVVANMGDSDIQAHLLKNFNRLDNFEKIREEVLELSRASHYLNSQARPMELGAFPGKGKKGDGKGKKGGKGKDDKTCHYCKKPGHLKADCRQRQNDEAAQKPKTPAGGEVVCNYCKKKGHKEAVCKKKKKDQQSPRKIAATAESAQEPEPIPHTALQLTEGELHERVPKGFLLPMMEAEAKMIKLEQAMIELERAQCGSCSSVKPIDCGQTTCSDCLTGKPLTSMLAPMKRAMVDTGAGASVFPRGFSTHSVPDRTRKPIVLTTATSEDIAINDGRMSTYTMGDGSPVRIKHHDSDQVTVPVISVSETATEGNWTIFGPNVQKLMGPDASRQIHEMLEKVESVDMTKHRGVYWLDLQEETVPSQGGWPLCAGEVRPARQASARRLTQGKVQQELRLHQTRPHLGKRLQQPRQV